MGRIGSRKPTFNRTVGRDKIFAWLENPELQKTPKEEYMQTFGLNETTWRLFEFQWEQEKIREVEKTKLTRTLNRERKKRETTIEPIDEEDPVGWWKRNGRSIQLNQAIFESATQKLNPNSMKLAKQLAGELIEKKEVTIGLQPDDYYRIHTEARRRIQETFGNPDGNLHLLPESSILSQEVCVDNQQEHSKSSEVASMAISARPD